MSSGAETLGAGGVSKPDVPRSTIGPCGQACLVQRAQHWMCQDSGLPAFSHVPPTEQWWPQTLALLELSGLSTTVCCARPSPSKHRSWAGWASCTSAAL